MVGVRVPGTAGEEAEGVPEDGYEPAAGLDQPTHRQGRLAEHGHPVTLANGQRLATDVECLAE